MADEPIPYLRIWDLVPARTYYSERHECSVRVADRPNRLLPFSPNDDGAYECKVIIHRPHGKGSRPEVEIIRDTMTSPYAESLRFYEP